MPIGKFSLAHKGPLTVATATATASASFSAEFGHIPAGMLETAIASASFAVEVDWSPWMSTWRYRVEITPDQSKMASSGFEFGNIIRLSSASGVNARNLAAIFSALGNNFRKIALTLADGRTQKYVEVERWDAAANDAVLHAKGNCGDSSYERYFLYFDPTRPDNTQYVSKIER